jgi:hypothetical protein
MGVEYRHFMIPHVQTFRPDARQLHRFVEKLGKERWIAVPGSDAMKRIAAIEQRPLEDVEAMWLLDFKRLPYDQPPAPYPLPVDWFVRREHGDHCLKFPVNFFDPADLRFPFVPNSPYDYTYFTIEIHLADKIVRHISECVDVDCKPITCPCGEDLAYSPNIDNINLDIFYSERIRNPCPECGRTFDPAKLAIIVRNGRTGKLSIVPGGAMYRFAVVINCGKSIPVALSHVAPGLAKLYKAAFKMDFKEVGDFF